MLEEAGYAGAATESAVLDADGLKALDFDVVDVHYMSSYEATKHALTIFNAEDATTLSKDQFHNLVNKVNM